MALLRKLQGNDARSAGAELQKMVMAASNGEGLLGELAYCLAHNYMLKYGARDPAMQSTILQVLMEGACALPEFERVGLEACTSMGRIMASMPGMGDDAHAIHCITLGEYQDALVSARKSFRTTKDAFENGKTPWVPELAGFQMDPSMLKSLMGNMAESSYAKCIAIVGGVMALMGKPDEAEHVVVHLCEEAKMTDVFKRCLAAWKIQYGRPGPLPRVHSTKRTVLAAVDGGDPKRSVRLLQKINPKALICMPVEDSFNAAENVAYLDAAFDAGQLWVAWEAISARITAAMGPGQGVGVLPGADGPARKMRLLAGSVADYLNRCAGSESAPFELAVPHYLFLQTMAEASPEKYARSIKEHLEVTWCHMDMASRAFLGRAVALSAIGEREPALALLRRVEQKERNSCIHEYHHVRMHALAAIADIHVKEGRPAEAITVLQVLEKLPQRLHCTPVEAELLAARASALHAKEDYERAIVDARRAEAIYHKVYMLPQEQICKEERIGCLAWAHSMALLAVCLANIDKRFQAGLWRRRSQRMLTTMYGRVLGEQFSSWRSISRRWGYTF